MATRHTRNDAWRRSASAKLASLLSSVRRQEVAAARRIQACWRDWRSRNKAYKELRWQTSAAKPEWLLEVEQQKHEGIIRTWSDKKGRGFIRNTRILRLSGYDVRFRRAQLPASELLVGSHVAFEVEFDAAFRPRVKGMATGKLRSVESCLQQQHSGTVCDVDFTAGRGFIHNEDLHRLLGKDVLFRASQVPGAQVGQSVCFNVELDLQGRPRMKEAIPGPGKTRQDRERLFTTETLLNSRHTGVLASVSSDAPDAQPRFVLRNAAIRRLCGRDATAESKELGECSPGDFISFNVRLTSEGSPIAVEIRGLSAADAPPPPSVLQDGPLHGIVCERNEASGFGFLRCPEVQHLYGQDVFFYPRDFPEFRMGHAVSFRLSWDDVGRPRVADPEADPEESPMARSKVEVSLDADFGALGLGLRCGHLPEVGHIREDLRKFWEIHGVHVGDRLLYLWGSVEGGSLEGLRPSEIRGRLGQRPLRLVFLSLHGG